MKKIIYGCLIALLAISFGCEKEEINITDQDAENTSNANVQKNAPNVTAKANGNQQLSNFIFLNTIPPGTETMYLYLNMDLLEDEYNTDPSNTMGYIGDFSTFYRSYWESYFTIYTVEFSPSECEDNIERWTINRAEYIAWLLLQAGTAGSNTTSDTSVKPEPLKKKGDDEDEEGALRIGGTYNDCFI